MSGDDIDTAVDNYFSAREVILEHFGYVEGWRDLPIEDSRDQFWAVDEHEDQWVKFSPNREALIYWLADHDDEYGPYGNELYENEIYTQRHLKKWVLRGPELTMVVVDTNTDGNKFIQLFRTANEVKPEEPEIEAEPEAHEAEPVVAPAPRPAVEDQSRASLEAFTHAVDRMIASNPALPVEEWLTQVRSMSAGIPAGALRIAINAHRARCLQPACPVLTAMEQMAGGSTSPLPIQRIALPPRGRRRPL